MAKILIVEDEEVIRKGLVLNMEMEDYEVEIAVDGEQAIEKLTDFKPDLILLDLMIPKMSGFEVCRYVRKKHPTTWVIMLTAKSDEPSKVTGLEMGADDYVTKPFSILELIARVKSGLRRQAMAIPAPETNILKVANCSFDFKRFSSTKDGEPIELVSREYQILQYFSTKIGEVVLREELLEKVWGYDSDNLPSTRTVDNHMVKLRQKIEPDPTAPRYLISVRGVGYKLEV